MNRCRWPSERAAAEHIVKFTAVSFAHGLCKIFFHAGTCGTINGPDAGGVLFEYAGAPRKMYPAVAALTRLLGVPNGCIKALCSDGQVAYVFKVKDGAVAIAWCEPGRSRKLRLTSPVQACDIMGNALPGSQLLLQESPVYLTAKQVEPVLTCLAR